MVRSSAVTENTLQILRGILYLYGNKKEAHTNTMSTANVASVAVKNKKNLRNKENIFKRFWKTRFLFLLFLPALIYYIMFKYVPMWGIRIAFYDYNLFTKFHPSNFCGLENFEWVFTYPHFFDRVVWNTLVLGLQNLVIYFPITVFFALMLNEIRGMRFKKITQTVSYMPHFLSLVVVCSLIISLLDITDGAVNAIIKFFGGQPIEFLAENSWFRPIMLISHTWQGLGWSTIVFLAAISSVDPALYEAARLDGAGRWRQMTSITLPAIAPTVSTMLILQVGHILDASFEKIYLLRSEITKVGTAHTLGTFVYDIGLTGTQYGPSTAVSLFTNLVNMAMLLLANWGSKKLTDSGIF